MEGGLSWYFAYGSNMSAPRLFDERLKPEGVPAGERIAGRLDGWRLAFNKRGAQATARGPATSCWRRARWCTAR